jgi:hypothetical protein
LIGASSNFENLSIVGPIFKTKKNYCGTEYWFLSAKNICLTPPSECPFHCVMVFHFHPPHEAHKQAEVNCSIEGNKMYHTGKGTFWRSFHGCTLFFIVFGMINSRTTFVALHFKRQTKIILIKGVGCRKLTLIKLREKKYGKEEDLSSDFCIYREIVFLFYFYRNENISR